MGKDTKKDIGSRGHIIRSKRLCTVKQHVSPNRDGRKIKKSIIKQEKINSTIIRIIHNQIGRPKNLSSADW